MEHWKRTAYKVAIFMFLFGIKPLGSYLTAYLTGPDGNVSLSEVANLMESLRLYSALIAAVMILCVPESLYKPAIIAFTCCSTITYLMMTNSPSLALLRVLMACIGLTTNTYILVFSYMYAHINDEEHYLKATSIASTGLQLGVLFGSIISQIVVSIFNSYTALPYCDAFAMFLCTIYMYLFLRKTKDSYGVVYELNEKSRLLKNRVKPVVNVHKNIVDHRKRNTRNFLERIINDLKSAYSNTAVLKRSFVYMIYMGVHYQIIINMDVLFSYIVKKHGNMNVMSNGFVQIMITLCGSLSAHLSGKLQFDFTYYGDAVTGICFTVLGIIIMSCYFYDNLFFVYLLYTIYGFILEMLHVLNFSEIAKKLKCNCYSLVLGFNLFGSLLISNILSILFVQINLFNISIPGRFLFIGGLEVIIGIMFLFLSFFSITKNNIHKIIFSEI